jgi:hypothetical protein
MPTASLITAGFGRGIRSHQTCFRQPPEKIRDWIGWGNQEEKEIGGGAYDYLILGLV